MNQFLNLGEEMRARIRLLDKQIEAKRTRVSELRSEISSTEDELNSLISLSHEYQVAIEKLQRGERVSAPDHTSMTTEINGEQDR